MELPQYTINDILAMDYMQFLEITNSLERIGNKRKKKMEEQYAHKNRQMTFR